MRASGIYRTDESIKVIHAKEVKRGKSEVKEYNLDIASLKEEEAQLSFANLLKDNKIDVKSLVFCVSRSQVMVRCFNVPSHDEEEIKSMVENKLPGLFPCNSEELIFDTAIVDSREDGYSYVMVAAVFKRIILEKVSLLKEAKILPDRIEISTFSLFKQVRKKEKSRQTYLLAHIEDNILDIITVCEGKLNFSRGIKLKAESLQQDIIREIKHTLYALKVQGIDLEEIILSGPDKRLNDLVVFFVEAFRTKVGIDEDVTVARGLILEDTSEGKKLNLLPEEFKIRKIESGRKKISVYFVVFLLLNLSLITNIVALKMKEKKRYGVFLRNQIQAVSTQTSLLRDKILKLNVFHRYYNSSKVILGLLTELYRNAPDSLYLTLMEMKGHLSGGTIVLEGKAQDDSAVLNFSSMLSNSPFFGKAEVKYIKKGSSIDKEIYTVEFEIRTIF